jgi:hypothetical protein
MFTLLLALLLPVEQFTRDEVDIAEWNTVATEHSRFTQVIFWGWNGERIAVRGWWHANKVQRPVRVNGRWVIRWHDDRAREIRALRVIETVTDYDPERDDLIWTKGDDRQRLK